MRKKHEIVEAVVLSVCEVFEIDNWRKLQAKTQLRITTIAKYVVINLISAEIKCSYVSVHDYFPLYQRREAYNCTINRLMEAIEENPSIKLKYEKAKQLAKRYFLLKPDTFEIVNA